MAGARSRVERTRLGWSWRRKGTEGLEGARGRVVWPPFRIGEEGRMSRIDQD